jgi:ubiquinone/menaquinone biosynthesis C-methylase UbiE
MAKQWWPDLSRRQKSNETIDNPAFSGGELTRVLAHFRLINRWLGNYRQTRRALNQLLNTIPGDREIHIVDLGCGGGDLLCFLKRSFKNDHRLKFTGIDYNPHTLKAAAEFSCDKGRFTWLCADVTNPGFELPECDILIASHFIYRFDPVPLENHLRNWQRSVSTAMVFSELRRSNWSYLLFKTAGSLVFRSKITINDGLRAISGAYKPDELKEIWAKVNARFQLKKAPLFRQIIVVPCKR